MARQEESPFSGMSEGELLGYLEASRDATKPERECVELLRRQIREAQRGLDQSLALLAPFHEDEALAYERLAEIGRQRQEEERMRQESERAKGLAAQVEAHGVVFSRSGESRMLQSLGNVLYKILSDQRFSSKIVGCTEEGGINEYLFGTNAKRIKIETEEDSVRLALLGDGSFVLGYHPKDDETRQALASAYKELGSPSYRTFNPHFVGLHIIPPKGEDVARIEHFAITESTGTRAGEDITTFQPRSGPSVFGAIDEKIADVLRDYTAIVLPKHLGDARIERVPRQ